MHSPLAIITESVIDPALLRDHVLSDAHGALVEFSGLVRNHDHDKSVTLLEYQVHPDALPALQAILDSIAAIHPESRLAAAHRYGVLAIGDLAFAVAVSSAHRDAAFGVAREVVERVKAELPIWKRQEFADGSHEWVNFA